MGMRFVDCCEGMDYASRLRLAAISCKTPPLHTKPKRADSWYIRYFVCIAVDFIEMAVLVAQSETRIGRRR